MFRLRICPRQRKPSPRPVRSRPEPQNKHLVGNGVVIFAEHSWASAKIGRRWAGTSLGNRRKRSARLNYKGRWTLGWLANFWWKFPRLAMDSPRFGS